MQGEPSPHLTTASPNRVRVYSSAVLLRRSTNDGSNRVEYDDPADHAASDVVVTPDDTIATFIRIDRIGATLGLAFVAIVNALTYRSALLWLAPAVLILLIAMLTLALHEVRAGRRERALVLTMAGNWVTALVIPVVLPFLWSIMILVAVMPLVLAAPHLPLSRLTPAIAAASLTAAVVAIIGLVSDEGGAIPDIDDALEFAVVVGALSALTIPIALVVWQTNQLQRGALDRANELNRELRQSQAHLAASRRRVVDSADTARIEIERDLHDGAQQRLVALRMRMAAHTDSGEGISSATVGELIDQVDLVVDELRSLARGIYPPVLAAHGLSEALVSVAQAHPVDVRVQAGPIGRLDAAIERAAYFTALEAFTNAAKHAPDASMTISVTTDGDMVEVTISDDGPGFDLAATERLSRGLDNMADRVDAVGGTLEVRSGVGHGTIVVARLPAVVATA